MSQDIDQLVEHKVKQRLSAIAQEEKDSDAKRHIFLAALGAAGGWWLTSSMGAHGQSLWVTVGVCAFLGAAYEVLSFAFLVAMVALLVRCVG